MRDNFNTTSDRDIYNSSYSGSVYLSGPIAGLDQWQSRWGWRSDASRLLGYGIKVLSPMRTEDTFKENMPALMKKDYFDVDRADVVLVNLSGAIRISIGTVAEIGYAYAKGKPIVLVLPKDDPLHEHPFVTEAALVRVETLDEAIQFVNALLSEGV